MTVSSSAVFPLMVAGSLLASCQSMATGGSTAVADLADASGSPKGTASVIFNAADAELVLEARNMSPGTHGVHIHTTGRCDAPGFETAGGHWNPGGRAHGLRAPAGAHMGDLPNLVIGADGSGAVRVPIAGATMAGLLDSDGAAFIIHAQADDMVSDPSGNSGARIACGVFRPR